MEMYLIINCSFAVTVHKLDNEGRYEADGCEAKEVHSIELDSDTGNFFKDTLNWTTENIVPLVPDIIDAATLEASLGDWVGCVNSNQCANQCCSGKYSDGVLKCTPVGGFETSEGCVGGSASGEKLAEWQECTNSNQCSNQCCSGKYSDNVQLVGSKIGKVALAVHDIISAKRTRLMVL
jgi:hypothetical protein